MATVPVFLVTFNLIIPHVLTKRQLQGQICMVLEPLPPGTSGKEQEEDGEVKGEKNYVKSERAQDGNGRKERKLVCAIEKHCSLDFLQLLMA